MLFYHYHCFIIIIITISIVVVVVVINIVIVTQPLYESRMYWIHDPAPPTSRRPAMESADTPAPAILKESPGAPSTQPKHKKYQRRRRRKAARTANQNAASRQAVPMTPDERWANENSASRSTTRPSSAANDLPEMMSTPVYQHPSFHSSRVSQPPIPATNENAGSSFCLDHPEFSGLYKPAQTDSSCLSDPTECTATPALSCPNSWLACWLVRQLADRGGESLKVDPRRI